MQIVVTVAAVIVARLTANRQPSAEERQRAIDDLIDQVIVQMAPRRPAPAGALAEFAVRVRAALPALETPTVAPTATSVSLLKLKDAAETLKTDPSTLRRWWRQGKVQLVQNGRLLLIPKSEVVRLSRPKSNP